MRIESLLTTVQRSRSPFKAAGPYSVLDADRNTICSCSGPHKAGNQALFAASPDLLAACEAMLEDLYDVARPNAHDCERMKMLASVIGAAKGGAS